MRRVLIMIFLSFGLFYSGCQKDYSEKGILKLYQKSENNFELLANEFNVLQEDSFLSTYDWRIELESTGSFLTLWPRVSQSINDVIEIKLPLEGSSEKKYHEIWASVETLRPNLERVYKIYEDLNFGRVEMRPDIGVFVVVYEPASLFGDPNRYFLYAKGKPGLNGGALGCHSISDLDEFYENFKVGKYPSAYRINNYWFFISGTGCAVIS